MIEITEKGKKVVYNALNNLAQTKTFNVEFWEKILPNRFISYHRDKIGNKIEDDFIAEINRYAFDYLFYEINHALTKNWIHSNFGGWGYSNKTGSVSSYIWTHRYDLKRCNFDRIIEDPNAAIKLFTRIISARIKIMDSLIETVNNSIENKYNPNFDSTKAKNIINDMQNTVNIDILLNVILIEARNLQQNY